jgi:Domain of unknown function (DUF5753)
LTSEWAAAAPATAVVDVLGQEARRKAGGERDGRREWARRRGHRARARLDRQTLLDDTAHRFTLVIAEGVFGWRAGSREDMADQVERVADATRRENVRVGIIPWGTRATRFPLHAWDIYDRRAVSYGTVDATAILTEPRDVEKYAILFDTLASSAVYDDEARALLADIAHRYRRR